MEKKTQGSNEELRKRVDNKEELNFEKSKSISTLEEWNIYH